MHLGYARILSGEDERQQRASAQAIFQKVGAEKIFIENAPSNQQRVVLPSVLALHRPGDLLLVPALKHLGRTQKELIDTIQMLKKNGLPFAIVDSAFNMLGSQKKAVNECVEEFTRAFTELASEQTRRGMRALPNHDKGGRLRKLTEDRQVQALAMLNEGRSIEEVAKQQRLPLPEIRDWLEAREKQTSEIVEGLLKTGKATSEYPAAGSQIRPADRHSRSSRRPTRHA